MVSVYDFVDFRCFLKDRFADLKLKNPSFSFRSFNRVAGIKSSAFLKLVMDGKRNLGDEGIHKIAKGFKLSEPEAEYFEQLVKFNQATDNETKNRYFNSLTRNKKFLAAKPLTAGQYQLFSQWYYVAILELVRVPTRQKKDITWLFNRLSPPVDRKKIKEAVQVLKKLGLLKDTRGGSLQRIETMITTDDEVQSLAVANFHVEMSEMAGRAVMKEAAQEREFSALTILTSEKSFKTAKAEIQKFRKKLHSILEQEMGDTKNFVAQINLQMFKLSKGENPS